MKRFVAIANAGKSHQMAMRAIGRELRKQGHDFLLLGTEYQKTQFSSFDLPFLVAGVGSNDPVKRYFERAAEQPNLPVSATVEYMKGMAQLLSAEAPALLKQEKIDFVLADQEEPGAATAADLVLLCYKRSRRKQQGQRGSLDARKAMMVRRMVAIEFGLCRSGRAGRSPWLPAGWDFGYR